MAQGCTWRKEEEKDLLQQVWNIARSHDYARCIIPHSCSLPFSLAGHMAKCQVKLKYSNLTTVLQMLRPSSAHTHSNLIAKLDSTTTPKVCSMHINLKGTKIKLCSCTRLQCEDMLGKRGGRHIPSCQPWMRIEDARPIPMMTPLPLEPLSI